MEQVSTQLIWVKLNGYAGTSLPPQQPGSPHLSWSLRSFGHRQPFSFFVAVTTNHMMMFRDSDSVRIDAQALVSVIFLTMSVSQNCFQARDCQYLNSGTRQWGIFYTVVCKSTDVKKQGVNGCAHLFKVIDAAVELS